MSEKRGSDHLGPDVFVDLLDGTPVEASRQQHLEVCADCREELRELETTLSFLTRGGAADEVSQVSRSWRRWLAAAAALVLAVSALYWTIGSPKSAPTPAAVLDELLPPAEEDGEFRLLLAFSETFEGDWAADEVVPFEVEGALELDELTPDERQRFVEELAEELRSDSL